MEFPAVKVCNNGACMLHPHAMLLTHRGTKVSYQVHLQANSARRTRRRDQEQRRTRAVCSARPQDSLSCISFFLLLFRLVEELGPSEQTSSLDRNPSNNVQLET